MSLPVSFFLCSILISLFRSFHFYTSLFYIYIRICMYLSLSPPAPSRFLPSFQLFLPLSLLLSSRGGMIKQTPVVPSPCLMENPRACASRERSFGEEGGRKEGKSSCCPLPASYFRRKRTRAATIVRKKNRGKKKMGFAPIPPSDYRAESLARMEGFKESARKGKDEIRSRDSSTAFVSSNERILLSFEL